MARWFIVRHGETTWNLEARVQGQADTPLSDVGRAQVRALAGRMKSARIDRAYASDLSRARETAEILLTGRNIPLKTDADLRELDFGSWEGRLGAELAESEPELFRKWHMGDPGFTAPGGEGYIELFARIKRFVGTEAEEMASGNSLIIAHGGSVRGLLEAKLGVPRDVVGRFVVTRASLTILEVFPEGTVLTVYNDVSHYRNQMEDS